MNEQAQQFMTQLNTLLDGVKAMQTTAFVECQAHFLQEFKALNPELAASGQVRWLVQGRVFTD